MPAGAPKGNNNAAKSRRLSSVLQKRMEERKDEDNLMNVLLDKALEGDLPAIKEVFDRIDGKAKQSIDIADVTEARADELSDEELTDIAANSSD